jgi:hypothetical protein
MEDKTMLFVAVKLTPYWKLNGPSLNALPLYIESYNIDVYPDDFTLHCHDTKYW